ncbi:MAG: hypothetical protein R3B81_17950 [bacterium]
MRTSLVALAAAVLFATGALASDVCIVPYPGSGYNATVDCDPVNPQIHDNAWIGYSLAGPPCQQGICGFVGERGANQYGWSISASSTDPFVNSGTLPDIVSNLYLWLHCATFDGMSAAEFQVETDGSVFLPVAFTPQNGFLNAGTVTHILVAVGGCPSGPVVAGMWTVLYFGPVSVESESWGNIKAMYR